MIAVLSPRVLWRNTQCGQSQAQHLYKVQLLWPGIEMWLLLLGARGGLLNSSPNSWSGSSIVMHQQQWWYFWLYMMYDVAQKPRHYYRLLVCGIISILTLLAFCQSSCSIFDLWQPIGATPCWMITQWADPYTKSSCFEVTRITNFSSHFASNW